MSLFSDLKTNVAEARKPTPPANGYMADTPVDGIDNLAAFPLVDTPGQTFDTGAIVDDANELDSGGYGDTDSIERYPGDNRTPFTADGLGPHISRPVKRWTSNKYVVPIGGMQPLLVTPDGSDAEYITRVVITSFDVAVASQQVQVGPDDNGARAGASLPSNVPVEIFTGPVWLFAVAAVAAAFNVHVLVEYETPGKLHPAGADCGCHK